MNDQASFIFAGNNFLNDVIKRHDYGFNLRAQII